MISYFLSLEYTHATEANINLGLAIRVQKRLGPLERRREKKGVKGVFGEAFGGGGGGGV